MQEPEESTAEAEPECTGGLGLIGDRGVVQLQLLQTLAEVLEVVAVDREQTAEHHRLRVAVTRERLLGGIRKRRHRLTASRLAHVLDACDEVTHFARPEFGDGSRSRHACTDLDHFVRRLRLHEQQLAACRQPSVHHAHARDHAAIRVVLRVEDECLQRCVRVTLRRGDAFDDGVQQLGHADSRLGRDAQDVFCRNAEHLFDLHRVTIGISGWQVDLVQHGDDLEVVLECEITVGERLGLDPLRGIHDEHDTLTRGERSADLVTEVDVARGVDEMQPVVPPRHAHVLRLDRDPALALEVHRVEVLGAHVAGLDCTGDLEDAIGQRRLAVVDVGDDREIADVGEIHWTVSVVQSGKCGGHTGRCMTKILLLGAPRGRC